MTTRTSISTANTNNILTLMQSSPPPHSYRHSRSYRHFKNPPQPHMCIRTTTEAGEEIFINVLSWTRIVIPQEPSDPIPLYGGMRVPPGSPRSPPIVFAVMANPEVLKDSGRHSKDPEEKRAMVELMCDFVEAMNPGVKLVRNAVILKDRDISGELKDVWNAVQAQRDREREEQMLQQRQQQHYYHITTQQMFPKSDENTASNTTTTAESITQKFQPASHQMQQQHQEHFNDSEMIQTTEDELKMLTTTVDGKSQYTNNGETIDNPADVNALSIDYTINDTEAMKAETTANIKNTSQRKESEDFFNSISSNLNGNTDAVDQIDAFNKADEVFADNKTAITSNVKNNSKNVNSNTMIVVKETPPTSPNSNNVQIDDVAGTTIVPAAFASNNPVSNTLNMSNIPSVISKVITSIPTPTVVVTPIAAPPTKKDKIGGFLPNGCIFPRFKHNKNKDKESKGKDKEKTLLNALKKNKDKKIAPIEQLEKNPTATTTSASPTVDMKSQYENNFLTLESEVQKLDLNKIDTTTGNDMFIELKMSTSSTTAK